MDTRDVLAAVQDLEKRAERVHDDHVTETYVSLGSIGNALMSRDNGIVFGRRGTGKTHALKYLARTQREKGNLVIYIDMEKDLGSTESIYGDTELKSTYRATRLLVDVLAIIHEALLDDAFNNKDSRLSINALDKMMDHFSEVIVVDEAEQEYIQADERMREGNAGIDLKVGSGFSLAGSVGGSSRATDRAEARTRISGSIRPRVHFGALKRLMAECLAGDMNRRFWLLLDEWSGIPRELQPYIAEMLRRLFFGIAKVTVRVAAIPHRSEWRISRPDGSYVGVEVGAEIFPLLDLDEFVVFPARNKLERAKRSSEFFEELLYRHINYILALQSEAQLVDSRQMLKLLFTQVTAFQEMIRAAEGVPRDALMIVSRSALRAGSSRISTDHVRQAAAHVFQTGKAALLNAVPDARSLLEHIIADVISGRKARGFLLSQDQSDHPLIQRLLDDRILHIIKRGYSSKYDPGERFDVLQLDYGCYVQYLNTQSDPKLLFGVDAIDEDAALEAMFGTVEVPEDDYRAIRKAVLDLPEMLDKITSVGRHRVKS